MYELKFIIFHIETCKENKVSSVRYILNFFFSHWFDLAFVFKLTWPFKYELISGICYFTCLYLFQVYTVLNIIFVLATHGFSNEVPQNWWLKTREFYSLTVLEDRNPKPVFLSWNMHAQDASKAMLFLEFFWENPFLVLSNLWLVASSLPSLTLWPRGRLRLSTFVTHSVRSGGHGWRWI